MKVRESARNCTFAVQFLVSVRLNYKKLDLLVIVGVGCGMNIYRIFVDFSRFP